MHSCQQALEIYNTLHCCSFKRGRESFRDAFPCCMHRWRRQSAALPFSGPIRRTHLQRSGPNGDARSMSDRPGAAVETRERGELVFAQGSDDPMAQSLKRNGGRNWGWGSETKRKTAERAVLCHRPARSAGAAAPPAFCFVSLFCGCCAASLQRTECYEHMHRSREAAMQVSADARPASLPPPTTAGGPGVPLTALCCRWKARVARSLAAPFTARNGMGQ